MTTATILVSLALILLNGGFVALEFGLIGAQRSRIDESAATGSRVARSARRLQSDVPTTLGGAQLGITICSLLVGRLAEPAVSGLIEDGLSGLIGLPSGVLRTVGFAVSLTLVAAVHMVMGEMVPKNLSLIGPERTLLTLARPMAAYLTLARPVVRTLVWLSNVVLALVGVKPQKELTGSVTPAQFALMVRESAQSLLVDSQAPALVDAALRFEATTVGEVMTPITEASAVQLGQTLSVVGRRFTEADVTRLLVYGDHRSDVRGFVHCADLVDGGTDFDIVRLEPSHIRDLVSIRAQATLTEAVAMMRSEHVNLLVVTGAGTGAGDSAGTGTSAYSGQGVIRLDDLIAQLAVAGTPMPLSRDNRRPHG